MHEYAGPDVVCALLERASHWRQAVQEPAGDQWPAPVERVVVNLSGITPPVIEGRPCWPPVAAERWVSAARAVGIDAADRSYERIDCCRDGDDRYGGTVQVGQELLDLYVDAAGVLRVAPADRYLS